MCWEYFLTLFHGIYESSYKVRPDLTSTQSPEMVAICSKASGAWCLPLETHSQSRPRRGSRARSDLT